MKVFAAIGAGFVIGVLACVLFGPFIGESARQDLYRGVGLGFGLGFGAVFCMVGFNGLVGYLDRVKSGKA